MAYLNLNFTLLALVVVEAIILMLIFSGIIQLQKPVATTPEQAQGLILSGQNPYEWVYDPLGILAIVVAFLLLGFIMFYAKKAYDMYQTKAQFLSQYTTPVFSGTRLG